MICSLPIYCLRYLSTPSQSIFLLPLNFIVLISTTFLPFISTMFILSGIRLLPISTMGEIILLSHWVYLCYFSEPFMPFLFASFFVKAEVKSIYGTYKFTSFLLLFSLLPQTKRLLLQSERLYLHKVSR